MRGLPTAVLMIVGGVVPVVTQSTIGRREGADGMGGGEMEASDELLNRSLSRVFVIRPGVGNKTPGGRNLMPRTLNALHQ
mmetsp:Transcript_1283/g.2826  ORF Transcript_1283/g.2826 Transcript_1283/m.2826 type:complete len:80 (-) Transcript_1283:14-253(-)